MSDLKGVPVKYTKQEAPKSKYMKAAHEYADRYGEKVVQAKNWRLACLLAICLCFFSIGGTIYLGSRSNIIPYIMLVDGQTGALVSVTKATDRQQPDEKIIGSFIWEIVRKSRTLPKDLVVYKNNWEDVYTFLTEESANKMNEMALQSGHREKLEKGITSQLTLKSIMATKGDTYQIRWQETLYNRDGKIMSETGMEALFTVKQGRIDDKDVYINPLGLFVTDFSWSQER